MYVNTLSIECKCTNTINTPPTEMKTKSVNSCLQREKGKGFILRHIVGTWPNSIDGRNPETFIIDTVY